MHATIRALVLVLVFRAGGSLAITHEKHGQALAAGKVTVFQGMAGYSEVDSMGVMHPDGNLGQYTVELMRFVTGYRSGLDVLVDITPYSPILQAIMNPQQKATFYAFVGTSVTCKKLDPAGGCTENSHTFEDGHGVGVDVDLVFWPKASPAQGSPQPRDTVVLASGFFGSNHMFGRIATPPHATDGYYWKECEDGKICQTEHLFKREFQLALQPNDRVVLQLAVTGHGWEKTTQNCGEFCHAEYRVMFNKGAPHPLRISQWRGDCMHNPTGKEQTGTWDGSRNGWCPGSTEPGFFVDVTGLVHAGANVMEFDAGLLNNGEFESYRDLGGFQGNDRAQLIVGLSLFVYSAGDAESITKQAEAYTAAEKAIRERSVSDKMVAQGLVLEQYPQGDQWLSTPMAPFKAALASSQLPKWCSKPGKASPAEGGRRASSLVVGMARRVVCGALGGLASVRSALSAPKKSLLRLAGGAAHAATPLNIEKHQPWYQYADMSIDSSATTQKVFTQEWVNKDRQIVTGTTESWSPPAWDRVALRLKLGPPPHKGLGTDAWDRVASIGLFLTETEAVEKIP